METRVPARLSPAEGRKFGLTVGTAFLALAALSWWRGHSTAPTVLASLGGLLVLAGLAIPTRLGPVMRGWMGFAARLSRVTTPIMLGLIYYVVLTPTGLIMRLFGRRPMHRVPREASYWVTRPIAEQRADMQRQF